MWVLRDRAGGEQGRKTGALRIPTGHARSGASTNVGNAGKCSCSTYYVIQKEREERRSEREGERERDTLKVDSKRIYQNINRG